MNKTLALVTSVIVVAGVLAIGTAADAQVRYFGSGRAFYPLPPPGAPGFRESPMYAPDAPPPRHYENPGIPDHQLGSRG
jgi:hypothetical protein